MGLHKLFLSRLFSGSAVLATLTSTSLITGCAVGSGLLVYSLIKCFTQQIFTENLLGARHGPENLLGARHGWNKGHRSKARYGKSRKKPVKGPGHHYEDVKP